MAGNTDNLARRSSHTGGSATAQGFSLEKEAKGGGASAANHKSDPCNSPMLARHSKTKKMGSDEAHSWRSARRFDINSAISARRKRVNNTQGGDIRQLQSTR